MSAQFLYKNLLLYSEQKISQTEYFVMMTKEGSTEIVNFMTSGTGFLVVRPQCFSLYDYMATICHIVKLYYFFNNLFLYFLA